MKRSARKILRGVASVLAIALLAAACSSTSETASTFADMPADAAESTTTRAPEQNPEATTTTPADDEAVETSTGAIDFAPCGGGAECAMLEVPLDYDDPTGATTEVHITRSLARIERTGTMFLNPGGPGFGVEDMVRGMGQWAPNGENFDLVGIDPRGTGKSNPIDCNSNWEDDLAVELTPDDGFADDVDLYVEDFAKMAAKCEEEHSVDYLASLTTENAARDIETVRVALGDEPLNYLGYSYGTAIGSVYATLFPNSIRAMVLDGAVPTNPSESGLDLRAENIETMFNRLDEACDLWSACAVRDVGLLESIEALRDELDENGTIGPLTPHIFESAVGAMIGVPPVFRDFPDGLAQALDGDGELLSQIGNDFLTPIPTGGFVEYSGAFDAILCADGWNIWTGTVPELLPQAERTAAAYPFIGSIVETPCDLWPVTGDGIAAVDYTGSANILVIGNTYDPITPLVYSQQLAEELGDNATLLQSDTSGHTAALRGNPCIDDHVMAYFLDGDLPADGTLCLDRGLVGFGNTTAGDIVIDEITPGSPAEDAGLQLGDRIISVDGTQIITDEDFPTGAPGTVMEFVLERDGAEIEISATRGLPVWELWQDAE